jgi:competence ComEA-like helix-hairpin-helix protein
LDFRKYLVFQEQKSSLNLNPQYCQEEMMKKITTTSLVVTITALFAMAAIPPGLAGSKTGIESKVTYERIGRVLKGPEIDINTVEENTLASLEEIGPELARRIIDLRGKSGGFRNIAELKKVKGLDDDVFAKISPMLTVK